MKQQKPNSRRHTVRLIIASITFICALAAAGPILLERQISLGVLQVPHGLKAGETAPHDIYARRDIFYIDSRETEEKRQEAAASVQPLFHVSQDAVFRIINRHDALRRALEEEQDLEKLIDNFSLHFSRVQLWRFSELDLEEIELVMQLSDEYIRYMLRKGVMPAQKLDTLGSPQKVRVRGLDRDDPMKLITRDASQFILSDEVPLVLDTLVRQSGIPSELVPAVFDAVQVFMEPNILYDDTATRLQMEMARQQVRPISRVIEEGEIILKQGFLVTQEALDQLQAIEQQLYAKPPMTILSQSLFTVIIFTLFFTSIVLLLPANYRKYQYLSIVILFVFTFTLYTIGATYLFFRTFTEITIFFYPVALFSMLAVTLLGNMQIAVLIPVFLASLYGTVPGSTFFDVIFLTIIGILGILFVRRPNRRIDMILGTGKLMLSYLGIALIYIFHQSIPLAQSAGILAAAAGNAVVTGILVIILIPIFEHSFNLPTVFRLRELADTDSPVLKRMINTARGTYSHSVSVAELVDAASEAVGANKLLAKVGALYHDIGKIDNPEYFIENQTGKNKHDMLKPSLSAAVIKAHVKIGIEKAKQMKLPREVVDVIAQHHGSDVINYFYMEAIKASAKGEKINEKDFSYHGSPPATKEAALVMLADSVDAAARTLKQTTSPKIEKLIWSIITQKIERRQLSACDMSMKDLEEVKNRFLVILTGRFHTRIPYPSSAKGKK